MVSIYFIIDILMEKPNLEIERRFLLRELPNVRYEQVMDIEQCYLDIDGKEYRIREARDREFFDMKPGVDYDLTHKKYVSEGVFEEDIQIIRMSQYKDFRTNATHYIEKVRYIHSDFFRLKWEIDQIYINSARDHKSFLWIAEIELEDIKQEIKIPFEIQNKIIMEITGIKELSNRALAQKI